MKKRIIALLLAALMMLFAAACANTENGGDPIAEDTEETPEAPTIPEKDINDFFGIGEMPDIPDVPVATLGDYAVLRSDYAFFFQLGRSDLEYSAMMSGFGEDEMGEFWNHPELVGDGTTPLEWLRTNALNTAKEFAILYATAVKNGAQPDEAANLQSDMEVLSVLSDMGNDEQAFADFYHMTSQQLREVNHRINLFSKYQADAIEDISVSDDALKALYDDAPELYEKVTVRHVLIPSDDNMTAEEQAEALTLAEDILRQLKEGEDIGVLALLYSEDPGSKYSNGEYTFGRGEMVTEFEEWSFAAKQGDQGMVKTSFGYHIMELIYPADFESAKEEIGFQLRTEMFFQSLAEEHQFVTSPDWQINQAVIDSITV